VVAIEHGAVPALPAGRWHDVGGVADEQHPSGAERVGHPVRDLPGRRAEQLDVEIGEADHAAHQLDGLGRRPLRVVHHAGHPFARIVGGDDHADATGQGRVL